MDVNSIHFFVKYTLINFRSLNQHLLTFNQNQHLDIQHQDKQAGKYRDKQSKRESAFNLIVIRK